MTKVIVKGWNGEERTIENAVTTKSHIIEVLDELKELGLDKDDFVRKIVRSIVTQKDIKGKMFAFQGQLDFLNNRIVQERASISEGDEALSNFGW